MKKWMGIICVVCICLGMSGCAGGGQSHLDETDRGPYTDGVYEVQMPTYDKSWQEYGKVTVINGYITEVEYDALNESGEKKSKDTAYRDDMAVGNAVNGLPATYPEKAYQDLTQAFQAAQYDPEKVDSVAGATISSQNFKKVMTALMEKVREGTPGKRRCLFIRMEYMRWKCRSMTMDGKILSALRLSAERLSPFNMMRGMRTVSSNRRTRSMKGT